MSYTDLDLSEQADVATRKSRTNGAPLLGCKPLSTLGPHEPTDPDCVETADDASLIRADAAISAAGR